RELLKLGVECKFIVTINDVEYKSLSDEFKQATYNIGPIPIADCPSLYKYSDALFLPTLLECFTASYLEAMKMRIPIFTSNLDFAETICQDAAFYFNPLSVYSISTTISTAIKDECRLQEKIENGDVILKSFPDHIQRVEKFMKLINGDYNV
ncbi:TPA: glycosyltransferase, partial [Enterobacter cloacae]|nr:glycosyltransferase [Enterobacter cloacae]